jgi:hypothetical protein
MKVFISYSHNDNQIARQISHSLEEFGFEVFYDEKISLGSNVFKELQTNLLTSDAFIVLVSNNSNNSQSVKQELVSAIAYQQERKKPLITPIVIGDVEVPQILSRIRYLQYSQDDDFNNIINLIVEELNFYKGRKLAKYDEYKESIEKVKSSLAEYINDTFKILEKKERNNKIIAYFCYLGSIMVVILSIIFATFKITNVITMFSLVQCIQVIISNIVAVAMLIALSRLLFILGKSFMVESIRNADRIHAISFGSFI